MLFKGIDFLDYNYSTVGYLALASFLCPILAFGLVPLFESFFGITTDSVSYTHLTLPTSDLV
mgnify:CR=1 FL=1